MVGIDIESNNNDYNEVLKQLSFLNDNLDSDDFIEIIGNSDFSNNLKEEIRDRETYYTMLLEKFINSYKIKQISKHIFKVLFFFGMIACMGGIIYFSFALSEKILSMETEDVIKFLPGIITAAVSFISGIIGIPLVITNYLFDNAEDEKLIDLIGKMQSHDIDSLKHINNDKK